MWAVFDGEKQGQRGHHAEVAKAAIVAQRSNHYEAAFEHYLRAQQIPYVAVDEAKRSLLRGRSIKNLDFIVSAAEGTSWLVDVKGRLFPSGTARRYWTNWSTRDDLESLTQWEQLFGTAFEALFVFAYHVIGEKAPLPAERLFEFRGSRYGFVAVRLRDYVAHARQISPKWNTLAMPSRPFRRCAEGFDTLLEEAMVPAA